MTDHGCALSCGPSFQDPEATLVIDVFDDPEQESFVVNVDRCRRQPTPKDRAVSSDVALFDTHGFVATRSPRSEVIRGRLAIRRMCDFLDRDGCIVIEAKECSESPVDGDLAPIGRNHRVRHRTITKGRVGHKVEHRNFAFRRSVSPVRSAEASPA